MKAITVDMDQKESWNKLAAQEPSFAIMQSWEWGDYKAKLGWHVFRVAVEHHGYLIAGAQMLISSKTLGLTSVAYIPRGPFGCWMDEDVFSILFSKIDEIATSHHAIFLKVEPAIQSCALVSSLFHQNQFQISQYSIQPLTTIIMDISQDEESILHNMRKSTRRKIFSAERKGVLVRPGDLEDLKIFFHMMKITASRAKFTPKSYKYYESEWDTLQHYDPAGFFIASYEGMPIAAHIAYSFGAHAAFFHQVSSGEHANLNANCLLVWEEIKWARSKGCRTYDLWGIPNEVDETNSEDSGFCQPERTDGLWGVYKFKRGFSKNIVHYCGSFDRVYQPKIYNIIMQTRFFGYFEKIQGWLNRTKNLP